MIGFRSCRLTANPTTLRNPLPVLHCAGQDVVEIRKIPLPTGIEFRTSSLQSLIDRLIKTEINKTNLCITCTVGLQELQRALRNKSPVENQESHNAISENGKDGG